jgi:hypothetical protein
VSGPGRPRQRLQPGVAPPERSGGGFTCWRCKIRTEGRMVEVDGGQLGDWHAETEPLIRSLILKRWP